MQKFFREKLQGYVYPFHVVISAWSGVKIQWNLYRETTLEANNIGPYTQVIIMYAGSMHGKYAPGDR